MKTYLTFHEAEQLALTVAWQYVDGRITPVEPIYYRSDISRYDSKYDVLYCTNAIGEHLVSLHNKTLCRDELELLSPPGDTMIETLQMRKLTKEQLMRFLGFDYGQIGDLLYGSMEITESIAAKLEEFFGISASFWINREKNYRDKLKAIS